MSVRLSFVVGVLFVAGCGADTTAAAPPGTCAGAQTLSVGAGATGAIGTDDCKGPTGDFGDLYQFTLSSQTNIELSVAPSGFDAGIILYSGSALDAANGKLVFDLSGSGTIGRNAYLPAGSYFLVVRSNDNKTGSYKVASQLANADGCGTYLNWTLPGANFSGFITATDCAGNGVAKQDIFEFGMKAGQSVTVTATYTRNGDVLLRTGTAGSADLVRKTLAAGGSTSFSFTAPTTDNYRVHFIGEPSLVGGTIGYTASLR